MEALLRSACTRRVVGGEAEPVIVKLGVGVSNTKSRRDKFTPTSWPLA
ncbi:hypothetical protein ACFY7H_29440 [Streptomyces sp. NPDC012794]